MSMSRWGQQGCLVEDLFDGSDGLGGNVHRGFETHNHAGGEGISDRHPHPNTGNRERKQLIRHPVGERVRGALGDGDVGEHEGNYELGMMNYEL